MRFFSIISEIKKPFFTVLDSSSKLPSGILSGNLVDFGNFDQCLAISRTIETSLLPFHKIKGKYCLGDVKLTPYALKTFKFTKELTVKWAICIPDGCEEKDAPNIAKSIFSEFYNMSHHTMLVFENFTCQVLEEVRYSSGAVATM